MKVFHNICQALNNSQGQFKNLLPNHKKRHDMKIFMIPLTVPVQGLIFSKHTFILAWQIFKHQGITELLRVNYHFSRRRLSWRFWVGREHTSSNFG